MQSSVVIFPGSNCDRDIAVALEKFGFKNSMVWHNNNELPKSDLVVLPGGFSYGDYLRTGCIAAKTQIINQVTDFAKKGGLVLGICNGFQLLTEAGLLPGILLRNKYLKFICSNVHVKVTKNSKYFFKNIKKKILELHIAHNEGCYFADKNEIKRIEDNGQVALEYCNKEGIVSEIFNPNGSTKNIAGIFNKNKNVLGMMPHPERMIDNFLSGEDGSLFFKDLISKI